MIAGQRACHASHDLEPLHVPASLLRLMHSGKLFAATPGSITTITRSFGDSAEMASELADLVVAGIKRATASLARDYGDGREPMPKPRDLRRVAVLSTIGIVLATKCRNDKTVAL
jgi:hypothetical protein